MDIERSTLREETSTLIYSDITATAPGHLKVIRRNQSLGGNRP